MDGEARKIAIKAMEVLAPRVRVSVAWQFHNQLNHI